MWVAEANLLAGRLGRILIAVAFGDHILANLAEGAAIASPAEMFPGVSERDQRVRKVVFQAFSAVGDLLNVFENFLFVGCAFHRTKIAAPRADNYRAEVPNR